MDNIVITIARQYGSGGKTIGKMIAEELGIPFYSRDILQITHKHKERSKCQQQAVINRCKQTHI